MRTVHFTRLMALVSVLGAGGCGDLQTQGPIAIAYTPEGELIAFLDGEVRFFDTDAKQGRGSMRTGSQGGGGRIPFPARHVVSSDGKTLAVSAGREVEVYDVMTRGLVARIVVSDDVEEAIPIAGIALSAGGNMVAVSVWPIGLGKASRLAVWRVSDQSLVTEIAQPERPGTERWHWTPGLAFSPDGNILYGADGGYYQALLQSYLTAWSLPDGAILWESLVPDINRGTDLAPGGAAIESLTLSSDGVWLATAWAKIDLWRAADGIHQDQLQMGPLPTGLGSLAFTPDAQKLVVTHYTNELPDPMVFGVNGSLLAGFPIENSGCSGAMFSPDGTRIAAACPPFVKIWEFSEVNRTLIRQIEVTAPIY